MVTYPLNGTFVCYGTICSVVPARFKSLRWCSSQLSQFSIILSVYSVQTVQLNCEQHFTKYGNSTTTATIPFHRRLKVDRSQGWWECWWRCRGWGGWWCRRESSAAGSGWTWCLGRVPRNTDTWRCSSWHVRSASPTRHCGRSRWGQRQVDESQFS